MKSLVGLCVLISVVICHPSPNTSDSLDDYPLSYILVEKSPGVYVKEDLTQPLKNVNVVDDDVKVYIYTKQNMDNGIEIGIANASVANTPFDAGKPTCFVVHGWNNDQSSDVNKLLKNAILQLNDINVFIIDWSTYAYKNYITAHGAVPGVGKIVAKLVKLLEKNKDLTLDRTFIIGHSLGAHIGGLIGASLNGQLEHIIGLDPAWPLFPIADTDSRLDYTDAKYVQVIHTCAGRLGYPISIGHSDYYPNGGAVQQGCGVMDVTGSCAHGRSYRYLEESLKGSRFTATKCSNYEAYKRGECNNEPRSWMGGLDIDKRAVGDYFLDTNSSPPYAKV